MTATVVEGDLPQRLANALRTQRHVAVDTETGGLDWTRDGLHLCQLFTQETGPVLLRNVDSRPSELAAVFGDPHVTKAFHYAPFDLRFLEARWGIRSVSVQCTKAASRLLDPALPAPEHSLQALLHRHLGIAVDKGPVRTSDWGTSTLSSEQIAYAVGDVAHLLDLADVLGEELQARGQHDVFRQICAYMPLDAHLAVTGVPNPLVY